MESKKITELLFIADITAEISSANNIKTQLRKNHAFSPKEVEPRLILIALDLMGNSLARILISSNTA